jgi:hypothetical protein
MVTAEDFRVVGVLEGVGVVMTRIAHRAVLVIALAALVVGIFAGQAWASVDDTPTPSLGYSNTNPNPGWGVADYWWRLGWGQSVYPEFLLTGPPMNALTEGVVLGVIYVVDRSPLTVIDTSTPWAYDVGYHGGAGAGDFGTNTDMTIDLMSTWFPDGGPVPAVPLEGQWYLHYCFFSNQGIYGRQWDIPFGVDTTVPGAVTGLKITPSLASASALTTWTAQSRGVIKWDPDFYDIGSGVGYYQILLDGQPYIPELTTGPARGRVYEMFGVPWLITPPPLTWYAAIENIPPGAHKVSIVCVDRATNQGPAAETWFYSDPDTPTISWVSPADANLTPSTFVQVNAADRSGDPTVNLTVDIGGSTVATTLVSPPYAFKPDLTGFSSGPATLTATVRDHLGRTVTIKKAVMYDPTATNALAPTTSDDLSVSTSTAGLIPFESSTNPTEEAPAPKWWRQGWGNSSYPDFQVPVPSIAASEGVVAGFLYVVDGSAETTINYNHPEWYMRSPKPAGAWTNTTVDLASCLAYPTAGAGPKYLPGAVKPLEGQWFLHLNHYSTGVPSGPGHVAMNTSYFSFKVDQTPPLAVSNLRASPSTDSALAGSVSAGTRAVLMWTPDAYNPITGQDTYDGLSGVVYYRVFLDGTPIVVDDTDANGRVWEIKGLGLGHVTIENMPVGKHTLSVSCVDRATNEGPLVSTTFVSDPDVPTIAITSPSGGTIGLHPAVTVDAQDQGGIKQVAYELDGTPIGTSTSAPYSLSPDLSAFGAGLHTLKATVTDLYGRTAFDMKSVTLDKTPLLISVGKASPNPFFPIRVDRYRDTQTIPFSVNKNATVTLYVLNSSGSTVRTISKSVSGSSSFVWNGRWSADNKAHTGTFYYQIRASDSAGNVTWSGRTATVIRNYELKRIARNKVKVIPR